MRMFSVFQDIRDDYGAATRYNGTDNKATNISNTLIPSAKDATS